MKLKLNALLNKRLALPVAPYAIARVIQSLDEPDAAVEAIARDIADDPVLTGSLLRAANSAYFGLGRPVTTPLDAMRVLGLDKVRALVMATAVRSSFHHVPSDKLGAVWAVSLDAADIALSLAGLIGVDRATAYTAGMLHAVGMLVMHAGMPEEIHELDTRVAPMARARPRAEMKLFDYCYAQAGAGLLESWRLPQRFVDALEYQFSPLENKHHEVLAALVSLAGWRARADFCGLDRTKMATSYPDEVGLILNLDHDMMLGDIPGRGMRVTEVHSHA